MSAALRAVVVDDEPAAVWALVRLLKETGRVEVAGTAPGADEALALPGWAEVDVAFLDIVMPGMTGIELARRLPGNPLVVFVTGYDGYAEQAFRVNAVDFLRKPVAPAQLEETLDRLEGRLADPTRPGAREMGDLVARYLDAGTGRGATGRLEHVGGRVGAGVMTMDVAVDHALCGPGPAGVRDDDDRSRTWSTPRWTS